MLVKIESIDGKSVQQAASDRLHSILHKLNNSGKLMQDSMLWTVRNHFKTIYPDSKHYSPDKVQPNQTSNGSTPSATIDIDVPGVTRAYHDMNIRPRFRKYLTIPIHRQSYGKSAKDFNDLIFIQKKNGNKLLAQKTIGGLMFLYALKDHVFQKQNSNLMPSDKNLADNIFARITAYMQSAK